MSPSLKSASILGLSTIGEITLTSPLMLIFPDLSSDKTEPFSIARLLAATGSPITTVTASLSETNPSKTLMHFFSLTAFFSADATALSVTGPQGSPMT